MKKITRFSPSIRSKNHSCDDLRPLNGGIGRFPFRSVIRFGSRTPLNYDAIEVNSIQAIENSRSKLLMKAAFARAEVPQASWWNSYRALIEDENIPYPILAKRIFGFKGRGMVKLNSKEELEAWVSNNNTEGYYFEQFHNYIREYRLHCTKWGCFYSARKMLKEDTPDDKRWFRNDSNCIWTTEYTVEKDGDTIIGYNESIPNEAFDKPINWSRIEEDCVKSLKEVGLDVGGQMRRL